MLLACLSCRRCRFCPCLELETVFVVAVVAAPSPAAPVRSLPIVHWCRLLTSCCLHWTFALLLPCRRRCRFLLLVPFLFRLVRLFVLESPTPTLASRRCCNGEPTRPQRLLPSPATGHPLQHFRPHLDSPDDTHNIRSPRLALQEKQPTICCRGSSRDEAPETDASNSRAATEDASTIPAETPEEGTIAILKLMTTTIMMMMTMRWWMMEP